MTQVRFARTSPLERRGFQPSVPRRGPTVVGITPPTAPTFFGAVAEYWNWRIFQSWRLTPRLALGPDDEGRVTGDADFGGLAACALDSSRFRVTASASSCSAASCALAVSRACSAACAAACNPAAVARAAASVPALAARIKGARRRLPLRVSTY